MDANPICSRGHKMVWIGIGPGAEPFCPNCERITAAWTCNCPCLLLYWQEVCLSCNTRKPFVR